MRVRPFGHLWCTVVLAALAACREGPPTPLTRAAATGDTRQVEALLAQGANPDEIDGAGGTALMAAAREGHVDAMRILIKGGADVNRRDRRFTRWTPLVHAIHKRQDAAARLLLDSGAEVDASMHGGATPLIFAAAYGETAIVEELLSRGADPHRQTADGVTALVNAAGGGPVFDITDGPRIGSCHLDTVRALLRHSPDLELPANLWSRAARFLGRSKDCEEAFALLKARRSAARGSGPDQREGQGGDRQLPARDPQSAREAAKPGDGAQHD
jgi:ankyrin repeat protein